MPGCEEIASPTGPRWISWHEVSVRPEGGLYTETQSVGRDVTARVRAERSLAEAREKAEAANTAKGRFLAMVSHEIRTPLNGILGMADLLRDTALSAEQKTYVQAVRTSGDMLPPTCFLVRPPVLRIVARRGLGLFFMP